MAMRVKAGQVSQILVTITDGQSGQQGQVRALDAVEVFVPLAGKGRKEYKAAMDVLKVLANEVADNRGASTIFVEQSAADVRGQRVNAQTGVVQTAEGKSVTVEKTVSSTQQPGIERYLIRAGAIRGRL